MNKPQNININININTYMNTDSLTKLRDRGNLSFHGHELFWLLMRIVSPVKLPKWLLKCLS